LDTREFIRLRRKELGLTLEDVGKACGVGKATVQRWESGDIENMKADKIASLANVLRVSVARLMGWEEEPKKSPPADDWGGEEERAQEIRETMEIVKQLPEREQRIVLESVLGMVEALEKSRDT